MWRDRDAKLLALLSKPTGKDDRATIETLRKEMADIERRIGALNARVEKEFPDYAALASPKPLKAAEVQQLLGQDEALVFWLTGGPQTYVFALSREGLAWQTIPLNLKALSDRIAAFRGGLDVDELVKGLEGGKPKLFDLGRAHELYADAAGSGRIPDQEQASCPVRAHRSDHGAADSSARDRKTCHCRARVQGYRQLSRCCLAAQAPGGHGAAVGRQSQGAAGFCPQGPGLEADDRFRRSGVRSEGGQRRAGGRSAQRPKHEDRSQDAGLFRLLAGCGRRPNADLAGPAAARGHRRRAQCRSEEARRPAQRYPSAHGGDRDCGQARAARRLPHRLFRNPRPGRRRHPGPGRAFARAHASRRSPTTPTTAC